MNQIAAFVGHSFAEEDKEIVRVFLDFFDRVKGLNTAFNWDHAQPAEPKVLSQKVLEKMLDKNLFIGICTVREKVIEPIKLKHGFFRRDLLKAEDHHFQWKVSDWILQEIDLAFGRNMQIILIVEEVIKNLGGIQGDLEYIRFRRTEPEKAFPKILEMLNTIIPKKVKAVSKDVVETVEKEGETRDLPEHKEDTLKPQKDWDASDYQLALIRAIVKENKEEEDIIYHNYIQTDFGKKESEQIEWEAKRLFFQHWSRKGDKLQELRTLVQKNPNHSGAIFYLGRAYTTYEQFDKASECFQKSAELTSDQREKISLFCEAATALAKHGDKKGAYRELDWAKDYLNESEDKNLRLLKTMSEVDGAFSENDNFIAINEYLVDYKPDDQNRRFSLAYKYSELEENELSYYHYNILRKQNPNQAVWNNLGVAARNLGLSHKSIKAYQESERLGGTLAMSNLAHKLMDSGFVDEASEICERALKIEGYDKQIGAAITRIGNMKENQAALETEFLDSTKPMRKFYIKYAIACRQFH